MKTNHRRGFVAKRHSDKSMSIFTARSTLSDKSIGASIGNDFSNGHRGMAKAVRGAKKFVRSRTRFHEKQAIHRMLREHS